MEIIPSNSMPNKPYLLLIKEKLLIHYHYIELYNSYEPTGYT